MARQSKRCAARVDDGLAVAGGNPRIAPGAWVALLFAMLLPLAVHAQVTFRAAASAAGPGSGTITFRAATNGASGNVVFRAAGSSGTPTSVSPVFRAAASGTAATGVLTLTIARPANTVENDVMVASVGVSANTPTITPPSGWTLVRKTDNTAANANSLAVYYKVATASEPANYSWSLSASTGAVGGIQTFYNVDIASPVDVENGQTTPSAATHATPSVTTTVANTMIVTHHTYSSSQNWTPPGGMTESFDQRSGAASASGQSVEGNRVVQAVAGATGVKTATATGGASADVGNTHILALRPALRIPLPAGTVQNDVMIAAIGVQPNTAVITPPTGWTLVNRIDNAGATANSLAVYRKTAGAAEPASYLWVISGASYYVGGIQSFSGVDTTTPIDVQNGLATPSATTHATPSVTTTVANTMVVTAHTFASSRTWVPPGGMTESFDVASPAPNNANGQSLEGARVVQAAAGATGAKTANAGGNADRGATHILALRPSSTSINIARPTTAVENDFMVAAIGVTPSSVTITPPSGWTLLRRTDNAGGVSNSLAVYTKVAVAGEPASYYWTFSAAATAVGGIQAFAGVDTSNPVDIENGQTTASAATHATPNVTTTVVNTMVVTHHTYSSSQNWTPPGGMTESFDRRSGGASATGQSVEGNRVVQAGAGATGVKTATAAGGGGSADFGNTHILALRPQANNDIDLPTPAGTAADDFMIASIGFQPSTLTITPPAGWTSIRRTANAAGTANTLETFRRTAVAGEPAVHRFVFSAAATAAVGGIQSFAGVDTTVPVDVENGQTTPNGTTHATPSVTTTVAGTMIVTAHTFSSSATWTPPAGMIESADRANLTVPNAAGQSIELNRVDQGPIGATGVKTATASGNPDRGNTHILALRPAPIIVVPGGFNAFETSTAAGAIAGQLYTKLIGTNFSLDAVAILSGVQHGTFTATVQADLVTGSTGGANCPGTPVTIAGTAQSVNLTTGRGTTGNFNVTNAYRDVRVRVRYPVVSPTVTSCSTDNFSIRPTAFTVTSTDANNTDTTGTPAIKTGANFNLTAASVAGYDGTPAIDNTKIVGTPTAGAIGGSFSAAPVATGTATGASFFYNEVGNVGLNVNAVYDSGFTSVDQPNDCTADFSNVLVGGQYGCSFGSTAIVQTTGVSGFGRFIPDNFNVSYNMPLFGSGCGTFTYVGKAFAYTVAPAITVTARNGTNNGLTDATTTNYAGAYMKFSNAAGTSLNQAPYDTQGGRYSRFDALGGGTTPALDPAGLPATTGDPAIGAFTNGVGTLTFGSGTGLVFTRSATTPNAPFDADIALALNVIDTDGVVFAANPASFGAATAGNGMAFTGGQEMRYGRLLLQNTYGSELVALAMPMRAQYYVSDADGFATNTDDVCTSIALGQLSLSNTTAPTPVAGTSAKTVGSSSTTAAIGNAPFVAGDAGLSFSAPGTGGYGYVDVTVDLSATAWLRFDWNGTGSDVDPTGRASFGLYRGSPRHIYMRERY